jgi:hypothetical protein
MINHYKDWDYIGYGIEAEGFDYYFRSYTSPDTFEDKELRRLAEKYCTVADELENYLTEKGAFRGKPESK